MKNVINVTSKSIKNTANDLNHMQLNNRGTNFTATLKQSSSFIDIGSEKNLMKKMNHIEKLNFQSHETLNVNLNMNFVFDNQSFKITLLI